MNLKDERLHSVGFGQIEKISVPASRNDEFIKINVSFRGGVQVVLDVPRSVVYPSSSASPFVERQMVYVDFEIMPTASVRNYKDTTYAVSDITIGRVVEFRALTKEERA